MDLKTRLKAYAQDLGFDLIGVAQAGPTPSADRYEEWVRAGRAATMTYLTRPEAIEKRRDLRNLWPEARSIIVVAMNYYAGGPPSPDDRPRGRVARYAWGEDYHEVIAERLRALLKFLNQEAGRPVQGKIYVDTGPVLERAWAVQAGLGWIGKNSMLIHPRLGSYLFLGVLLVDLDLKPDPPFPFDHCGTCTRCIDACPTGCIRPDRTLEAERCLSYLTIERREEIPEDLRPAIGDWLFGCDICQEVCPWNQRFARPTQEPAFQPREGIARMLLEEVLQMDEATFRARFRRSAIRRAKWRGLVRNALVVAGNLRAKALKAWIQRWREHEDPMLQEHAAWAMEHL
ncbi:tRNA epoxyqueuosine(34) reductase QueG [Thermoflexus sp.]|uniref:tRNA epoxyqueuosine(34) reductase QueG n=1 Tax=Thermoflexus sp. TaxID=1969742 RepID=UPI0025EB025C|nr:tRNA epoxyqueuosine(34) reductase QueG [Thermoflexus sp.]MCS7350676.1 tRNA epoxyqueuosine(34) reductase QueG [Thermoflexus sp.]MCX7690638.1 tRNA epoxyqueuosine(34) reductase QueG [Thermoflexus sp.]MDW8180127.1 tRNA epoxyqueuosine(34) reductase QueG [Anaerolineae bacterium]